jgi:heterotetrameric sarcosine oxidase gamma subunit
MPDLQRCSPFPEDAREFSTAGFRLREIENVTKLRVQVLRRRGLQTPSADPRHLPDKPNTALGTDPIALWKAPDDWLVYSPNQSSAALRNWVVGISSDAPLVVTDTSSASVVFELTGPL